MRVLVIDHIFIWVCRLKLKRPALLLITFLLIITGCHRRLTGAYVGSYSTTEKEKRFNKNHSASDTTQSKKK